MSQAGIGGGGSSPVINIFSGSCTTVGAVTGAGATVVLSAIPKTYTFSARISGLDEADNLGVGYTLVGAVRTDGTTAYLIPGQGLDEFEETALVAADVVLAVSLNTAVFTVLGVAGKTMNWTVEGIYTFVA